MDNVHPHQGVGPLLLIVLTPAVLTQALHLNSTYKKMYSVTCTIIFTAPTSKGVSRARNGSKRFGIFSSCLFVLITR